MRSRHLGPTTYLGAALLAVAIVTSCKGSPSYPACKDPPAHEDVEAAQGAHSAAARFFEKGNYDQAIALWQAAYQLDCSAHPLLINIGHAYEKKGDESSALEIYRVYLDRAGKTADPAIVALVHAADQSLSSQPSAPLHRAPAASSAASAKPPASSP